MPKQSAPGSRRRKPCAEMYRPRCRSSASGRAAALLPFSPRHVRVVLLVLEAVVLQQIGVG